MILLRVVLSEVTFYKHNKNSTMTVQVCTKSGHLDFLSTFHFCTFLCLVLLVTSGVIINQLKQFQLKYYQYYSVWLYRSWPTFLHGSTCRSQWPIINIDTCILWADVFNTKVGRSSGYRLDVYERLCLQMYDNNTNRLTYQWLYPYFFKSHRDKNEFKLKIWL